MKNKLALFASAMLLFASCKKNKGTISHTYNKATAKYANIDEIRSLPLSAPAKPIVKSSKVFFGDRVILIGEKNKGIHVFNNSNAHLPSNVSYINLPYSDEFYVEGNFIYAESHYDFVKIDISDLGNPVLVDRIEYAIGSALKNEAGEVLVGFDYEVVQESFQLNSSEELALRKNNNLFFDYNNTLIPETDLIVSFVGTSKKEKGTLNRIATHNSHIYMVGGSDLYTFQNNSSSINFISKQPIGNDLETIFYDNGNLLVGTKSSMIVMSLANPDAPQKVSQYDHEISCDPVLPNGNVAYLTLRTVDFEGCSGEVNALEVIDINDIHNPTKINDIALSSPYGMALVGNHLFVGEGNNGITVLDVTDASNPTKVYHNSNINAFDVLKHPNRSNIILVINNNGLQQLELTTSNGSVNLQEASSVLLP